MIDLPIDELRTLLQRVRRPKDSAAVGDALEDLLEMLVWEADRGECGDESEDT